MSPAPNAAITVEPGKIIERILTLELVRVTERAAVASARLRGHGNEKAADQAAVDAMRRELNKLQIDGTVVIGEGERDEAPMLFIGEKVGGGWAQSDEGSPKVDISVDPLEGASCLLYQVYEDEAAYLAHRELPHYADFRVLTDPWVRTRRVLTYQAVALQGSD